MSGHIRTCIVCYSDSGVHNLFYVVELNIELFICVDTYGILCTFVCEMCFGKIIS